MSDHLSICIFCGTEHPSSAAACPSCGRAAIDERLTADEPVQLGFATEAKPAPDLPPRSKGPTAGQSVEATLTEEPDLGGRTAPDPADLPDETPAAPPKPAAMDVEAPVELTPHEIEPTPADAPVELTPHEVEPAFDRPVPAGAPEDVVLPVESTAAQVSASSDHDQIAQAGADGPIGTGDFDLADRPGPEVPPQVDTPISAADDALLDAMTAWPEEDLEWMTPEQREELARSSRSSTGPDATSLIAAPATPPIEKATPEPAAPTGDDRAEQPAGDAAPVAAADAPDAPLEVDLVAAVEPFEPDELPQAVVAPMDSQPDPLSDDDEQFVAGEIAMTDEADEDPAPAVAAAAAPTADATRISSPPTEPPTEPPSRTPVARQGSGGRSQTLVIALVVVGVIAVWFVILSLISRDSGDPVDIAGSDVVVSTTDTGTTLATTAAPTTTAPQDDGATATTAAPTTTATTLPPVPDIAAVGDPIPVADLGLGGFALGDLDFGSTDALGRLVATFGAPDAFEPMEGAFGLCDDVGGFTTTWGPLTGVFSGTVEDSVFEAYRVASGGGDHPASDLTTLSGLAPGDTVSELKSVYSGFIITLEESNGGSQFILTRGSDGRTLLWGPVSDTSDEGTVLGIYSPDACDGGPVPGP